MSEELIAVNWFNNLPRAQQLPHMARHGYPSDSRAITTAMKVHMHKERDKITMKEVLSMLENTVKATHTKDGPIAGNAYREAQRLRDIKGLEDLMEHLCKTMRVTYERSYTHLYKHLK